MFELAMPWALLGLLIPFLLWFILPRAKLQLPAALKVPFFNTIAGIVAHEKISHVRHKKISLLVLIWALLILALAGPRYVGEPMPLTQEGYNIMLALDLSGSMELADMQFHGRPVSRLAVVKRAAVDFVNQRLGDKIGLILFGTRAYLQTPLTADHHNILQRLQDATVGLAGQTTSIGDALGLAVKRLQNVPDKGRVIILLTDGVNNSGVLAPLKAAELAKDYGIKIYTIGLGSEIDPNSIDSVFYDLNGSADLDEDTLKAVADMTGGRYFRATDPESLQSIYQTINQMEKISQEDATVRPQHEYYPWPLAIAFLLFIYWQALQGRLLDCVRQTKPVEARNS